MIIANAPKRWRLAIRVLEQTGSALGELHALTWRTSLRQRRLRVQHGKTRGSPPVGCLPGVAHQRHCGDGAARRSSSRAARLPRSDKTSTRHGDAKGLRGCRHREPLAALVEAPLRLRENSRRRARPCGAARALAKEPNAGYVFARPARRLELAMAAASRVPGALGWLAKPKARRSTYSCLCRCPDRCRCPARCRSRSPVRRRQSRTRSGSDMGQPCRRAYSHVRRPHLRSL